MLVATTLLFLTVQMQKAIACITCVIGSSLLALDISDKAEVETLKSDIVKAPDKAAASAVFRSMFKTEDSKNAHIQIQYYEGKPLLSVHVNSGPISVLSWFPNNIVDQCASTTAEGLLNIAFTTVILKQQCDKRPVVGPEAFLTSLWPATPIASPYLPPAAYGKLNSYVIATQLALCFDNFRKSLNAKLDQFDKVAASCDNAVNVVTKAKLSISCTNSGKATEVTPLMLSACDKPGTSQQGQNKLIVMEMFDRICEDDTISKALSSATEPKRVLELFSEQSSANALVVDNQNDQTLKPHPKLAKDVEAYFSKPQCNCEGFRITDCDKDWPSGPLIRCENDKCMLELAKLIEMNDQLAGTGKPVASSGDSKPLCARSGFRNPAE